MVIERSGALWDWCGFAVAGYEGVPKVLRREAAARGAGGNSAVGSAGGETEEGDEKGFVVGE